MKHIYVCSQIPQPTESVARGTSFFISLHRFFIFPLLHSGFTFHPIWGNLLNFIQFWRAFCTIFPIFLFSISARNPGNFLWKLILLSTWSVHKKIFFHFATLCNQTFPSDEKFLSIFWQVNFISPTFTLALKVNRQQASSCRWQSFVTRLGKW